MLQGHGVTHYVPVPLAVAANNLKYMILTKKECLHIIAFYPIYSPSLLCLNISLPLSSQLLSPTYYFFFHTNTHTSCSLFLHTSVFFSSSYSTSDTLTDIFLSLILPTFFSLSHICNKNTYIPAKSSTIWLWF